MQANPDKFQVLAVGKKTYEKCSTMNIQNFELTCEDSVKLLGIEIDYQLNFDKYRCLPNPFMDVSPDAQNTIDLYLLFSV
jgi:hypothetical protein